MTKWRFRPSKEGAELFAKMVCEKVAESGMSIRQFGLSLESDSYKRPEASLRVWITASSVPPLSKVEAAAEMLGLDQHDVCEALYGCRDLREATAEAAAKVRDIENTRRRDLYNGSSQVRENVARQWRLRKGDPLRNVVRRLLDHADGGRTLLNRAVLEYQRRIIRHALCDEMYDKWMLHRAAELKAAKNAAYRRNQFAKGQKKREAKEMLRDAMRQIKAVRSRLAWVAKQVAGWDTPWGRAGYTNQTEWYRSGNTDAYDYMRSKWQVVSARRRAKIRAAGGDGITIDEWIRIKRSWSNRCAYCGAEPENDGHRGGALEMEHIVPLPIGPDETWNIVPACKFCNTSKAGKDLLVWADAKGVELASRTMCAYRRSVERITPCQPANTSITNIRPESVAVRALAR